MPAFSAPLTDHQSTYMAITFLNTEGLNAFKDAVEAAPTEGGVITLASSLFNDPCNISKSMKAMVLDSEWTKSLMSVGLSVL